MLLVLDAAEISLHAELQSFNAGKRASGRGRSVSML